VASVDASITIDCTSKRPVCLTTQTTFLNHVFMILQTIEHLWTIDLTGTNCVDATGLKDTLGNGFRRFNPASTAVNCTLTDPQHTCFFNETVQTFQGPGCVFDNTLYCACTHLTDFAALFTPPDVYILSFADLGALGSAYKTPIPLIVMGILAVVMVSVKQSLSEEVFLD
jgi:hypothetical protein